MNKLYLIVITVFLNLALFSCTPTDESFLESSQIEATGGQDGEILPDEEDEDGEVEN